MTDEKRRLKVLGKRLASEVLPTPVSATKATLGPRQRVLARLEQMTQSATVLAVAASLSGACGGKTEDANGTGTVEPPGGSGSGAATASGGSGGMAGGSGSGGAAGGGGAGGYGGVSTGGYSVVDPMPPPACVDPTYFASQMAGATSVHWDTNQALVIDVLVPADPYYNAPATLAAASSSGGLLTTITDPTGASVRVEAGGLDAGALDAGGATWPASVEVTLGFTCYDPQWGSTVTYHYVLVLDTSAPAASGAVPYTTRDGGV